MTHKSGVMGLDLSVTGTGWAYIGSNHMDSGRFRIPTAISKSVNSHVERLQWLSVQLAAQIDRVNPALVVMEDYSYGSKGRGVYTVAEWGGIVRLMLLNKRMRSIGVPPLCLKQFACPSLKANAVKKNHVIDAVNGRWGRAITDDNEADAFVLAVMGQGILNRFSDELGQNKTFFDRGILDATQEGILCKCLTIIDFPLARASDKAPPRREHLKKV